MNKFKEYQLISNEFSKMVKEDYEEIYAIYNLYEKLHRMIEKEKESIERMLFAFTMHKLINLHNTINKNLSGKEIAAAMMPFELLPLNGVGKDFIAIKKSAYELLENNPEIYKKYDETKKLSR